MLPPKIEDQLLEQLNDHFRSVSTKFVVSYRLDGEPRDHPVTSVYEGYDWIRAQPIGASHSVTHCRVLHADGPLAGQAAIVGLTC